MVLAAAAEAEVDARDDDPEVCLRLCIYENEYGNCIYECLHLASLFLLVATGTFPLAWHLRGTLLRSLAAIRVALRFTNFLVVAEHREMRHWPSMRGEYILSIVPSAVLCLSGEFLLFSEVQSTSTH